MVMVKGHKRLEIVECPDCTSLKRTWAIRAHKRSKMLLYIIYCMVILYALLHKCNLVLYKSWQISLFNFSVYESRDVNLETIKHCGFAIGKRKKPSNVWMSIFIIKGKKWKTFSKPVLIIGVNEILFVLASFFLTSRYGVAVQTLELFSLFRIERLRTEAVSRFQRIRESVMFAPPADIDVTTKHILE